MFLKKHAIAVLIAILGLIVLFGRLGQIPLGHEEPRRALIALELLYGDNPLQATLHGENYYRKPPLYNWVLAGFYKIFGTTNEFVSRFPSVIFFLLLSLFVYRISKPYLGKSQALIAAILFFISEDLILYYSRMAEMDLFYSLLTFPVIVLPWVYLDKDKVSHFFVTPPFLAGLGFVSKGLPSIAFLGISMLTAIVLHKKYKLLYSPKLALAIIVFALPLALYFVPQYYDGTINESLNTIFGESVNRTTDQGFLDRVAHLVLFPLDTLKGMLPAALLIFLVRKRHFENRFVKAVLVLFAANYLIYLISPGARLRYVYMLFPLLAIIFSSGLSDLKSSIQVIASKTAFILSILISITLIISCFFIFKIDLLIISSVLISLAVLGIAFKKKEFNLLPLTVVLMLLIRAGVDFISIQDMFRTKDKAWLEKSQAIELYQEYPERNIYLNTKAEQYYTFSYEYTRLKKQLFEHNIALTDKDGLYIVRAQYAPKELKAIRNFTIGNDSSFILAEWQ